MTGMEIAQFATLVTAAGGILVAMMKIIGAQTLAAKELAKKPSTPPPPANGTHGPCNEAVDRLTDALHEEIEEQRAFRRSFETWMAREEGRRDAMRQTGEFQAPER